MVKTRLRTVGMVTVAAVTLVSGGVSSEPSVRARSAQRAAPPQVRLPDKERRQGVPGDREAVGINGIVEALISSYDRFDVLALGEMHDGDRIPILRMSLVVSDFAKKVRTIVVEVGRHCGKQATLDATFEARTSKGLSSRGMEGS
jgi:hypothetical protein